MNKSFLARIPESAPPRIDRVPTKSVLHIDAASGHRIPLIPIFLARH